MHEESTPYVEGLLFGEWLGKWEKASTHWPDAS
jgi:hypothetical protein